MNILLGVTGGIAAYKACDIVTKLRHLQHDVRVMMTYNGTEFIHPTTLASLSGHQVLIEMWGDATKGCIEHIEVTQWADVLLVAPASANIIGKFANGIADDYLSTVYLAMSGKRIVLAPAMNTRMWESCSVQRNVLTLKRDRVEILEPEEGRLACGAVGQGKLRNTADIVKQVLEG